MTDTLLIFIPLVLFFLVLVFTMLWTERTRSRRYEAGRAFSGEYFLGSRSLSGFVLAMTLIATYGSVSSFVSGPGIAASAGWFLPRRRSLRASSSSVFSGRKWRSSRAPAGRLR